MICSITQSASYNCLTPIQAGLLPKVVLINTDDILSLTYSGNYITAINLKPGKYGYQFDGIRRSVKASYNKKDTKITTNYTHKLSFAVFDISAAQKENLRKLSFGKVIGITFNINSPGNADTYFEVFGAGAGLETTKLYRQPQKEAAYQVELETLDGASESKLPYTLFNTDYNTTLDLINALLLDSVGFPYTFPYILS